MYKSYYHSAEITCVQFEVDRFYTSKYVCLNTKKLTFRKSILNIVKWTWY